MRRTDEPDCGPQLERVRRLTLTALSALFARGQTKVPWPKTKLAAIVMRIPDVGALLWLVVSDRGGSGGDRDVAYSRSEKQITALAHYLAHLSPSSFPQ